MNWIIYVIIAITAAVARDITQKQALQHEHTSQYLAIRAVIFIILGVPLLPYTDFTFAWNGYVAACTAAGVLSAAILYRNEALKNDDVSIVQPLGNLQPVFVTAIAWTVLDEALTTSQIIGVATIVAGTYWLETDRDDHGIRHVWDELVTSKTALYVVLASVLFAISNTLARYVLTNHTNAFTYYFLGFGLAGILVSLYSLCKYGVRELLTITADYGWEISIPAALTAIQIISLYQAFSLTNVALAVALYRTQTLFTTVEGGMFFHETDLVRRGTAAALTVGGAALVIL